MFKLKYILIVTFVLYICPLVRSSTDDVFSDPCFDDVKRDSCPPCISSTTSSSPIVPSAHNSASPYLSFSILSVILYQFLVVAFL